VTATLIEQAPIDVTDDLTRAKEVVATARSDAHVAIIAHTALLTVETLAQQVAQVEAEIQRERNEWSQWVQKAIDRSREVANDADWCGVYDATMERLGFPGRAEEVEVGWYTTVTMSRNVDEDDIKRIVRNEVGTGNDIEVTQPACVQVSLRVSGSRTAREGECICDEIDSDVIDDYLPSWTGEWSIDDNGSVCCDNH
jgi:hypothetical protein